MICKECDSELAPDTWRYEDLCDYHFGEKARRELNAYHLCGNCLYELNKCNCKELEK